MSSNTWNYLDYLIGDVRSIEARVRRLEDKSHEHEYIIKGKMSPSPRKTESGAIVWDHSDGKVTDQLAMGPTNQFSHAEMRIHYVDGRTRVARSGRPDGAGMPMKQQERIEKVYVGFVEAIWGDDE